MDISNEVYETDETLDIKTLSYEFVFLEGIRETLKLFREDWRNNISQKNRLIDSLNGLDALLEPLTDKEYQDSKTTLSDNPKEYFRLIIRQLYKKNALSRKKVDVI
jgi:hypothetical protein